MSKLEELIARLCPDGVEYKAIGEMVDYEQPSRYIVNSTKYDDSYSVPVLTAGQTFILGYTNETEGVYEASEENPVIIFDDFTAAFKWVDFRFKVKSSAMKILTVKNDLTTIRYIFHVMGFLNIQSDEHKRLWISNYSQIKVPVPPLEVQREIVHILDSFTFLTAELAVELAARQKQYEFYRDALLTFKNIDDTISNERTNEMELSGVVRWMKLGDIGPVCMCKRILKSETNSQSGVPFYKIGTFGKEADAYISHEKFSEYKAKYNFPKKGDVLISAAGTIGRTVIYDGKPAYFQDSNIVWIDNDETQVTNAFLKYYYSMKPWKSSDGGTISRLYNDDIRKTPVPVPPLSEQQRIVDILDRFDALCNDITSGLPAEIEARKKQYEYYRDKLLTFKELKKEA